MEGKIIVTVVGKDKTGIVASVSSEIQRIKGNIIDISQTIIDENIFAMIMLVDMKQSGVEFNEFKNILEGLEEKEKVKIYIQHEDIFHAMHRI